MHSATRRCRFNRNVSQAFRREISRPNDADEKVVKLIEQVTTVSVQTVGVEEMEEEESHQ